MDHRLWIIRPFGLPLDPSTDVRDHVRNACRPKLQMKDINHISVHSLLVMVDKLAYNTEQLRNLYI